MINNEHNPIAIRISNVQDLWIEIGRNFPMQKFIVSFANRLIIKL